MSKLKMTGFHEIAKFKIGETITLTRELKPSQRVFRWLRKPWRWPPRVIHSLGRVTEIIDNSEAEVEWNEQWIDGEAKEEIQKGG